MRSALVVAGLLLLAPVAPANAAVGVSIGINIPVYPRLVPVPGYPVYYAPAVNSNYFFYDGMYWDFDGGNWYSSPWYNGPWTIVDPFAVPVYLLDVPVRYYHRPPAFFRGWALNEAPRWHEHWGRDWAERRHDWDHVHHDWNRGHWDNRSMPARAPLPTYQRNYTGNRYPQAQQQAQFHSQNYRYQPREQFVQQQYQERGIQRANPVQRGESREAHKGHGGNERRDHR